MKFVLELVRQSVSGDQTTLHQPGNEGTCPRERIKDVNAVIRNAAVEFFLQQVSHRLVDEVNNFDRGIDNTKFFLLLGESRLEELFEELLDK